jgi:hypothetical protein
VSGKTPHELRAEAEAARDRLQAEVAALKGVLGEARTWLDPQMFGSQRDLADRIDALLAAAKRVGEA